MNRKNKSKKDVEGKQYYVRKSSIYAACIFLIYNNIF